MRNRNIIVLVMAFAAVANAATSIAVSPLTANGVSEGEAASLTDALRSELIKSGQYQVLERSQMEEILKEQGFQQSGACDETNCAIEIGKMLSVNQIILGSIGRVGKTYTLNIRSVDVGSGKIASDITEYHKGSIDGILTEIIPVATQKLMGTYKRSRKGVVVGTAIGVGVIAAVAIPVIILANQPEETEKANTTELDIKWGE